MTLELAKKQARLLHSILKQQGYDTKLSACYEMIANLNNYPNWNAMCAVVIV